MNTGQVASLTTEAVAALSTSSIAALSTVQIAALDTAHIASLDTAQVGAIEPADVSALNTAHVAALDTADVTALKTAQVVSLNTAHVAALNTAHVAALNTAQVRAIETRDVAALNTAHVAALNTAQVLALTTAQVATLNTAHVAALDTADVTALTTAQVVALNTAHVAALNTAQLVALSTTQVSVIQTSDLVALSTAQLSALKVANLDNGYTTLQESALIRAGRDMSLVTPIVIDLSRSGAGVSTRSFESGPVSFDLDADGVADLMSGISTGSGYLVFDSNGNGLVDSGRELFGAFTMLNGSDQVARDGYEALKSFDSNSDGQIDSQDSVFQSLMVWEDRDGDGVTDAGELRAFGELGIASLDLSASVDGRQDNGNVVGLTSTVTWDDGQTSEMADVWFQSVLSNTDAAVEAIDDTLARYLAMAESNGGVSSSSSWQSDPSQALVTEMMLFDHQGGLVDVTQGLKLVDVSDSHGLNDPEELLRRQNGLAGGTSLGQT